MNATARGLADGEGWRKTMKEKNKDSGFLKTFPLLAAGAGSYDSETGRGTVTILEEGISADGEWEFKKTALEAGLSAFNGADMHLDHPSVQERKSLPERSVRTRVGRVTETFMGRSEVTGREALMGKFFIYDETWRKTLRNMKEGGLLEQQHVSIAGLGTGMVEKRGERNVRVISSIRYGQSVDFVTKGNAGGKVHMFQSVGEAELLGLGDLTKEMLEAHRPDLLAEIRQSAGAAGGASGNGKGGRKMAMDEKMKEEVEAIIQSTVGNAVKEALKTTVKPEVKDDVAGKKVEEELRMAQAKLAQFEVKDRVNSVVEGTELPKSSKARIIKEFATVQSVEGLDAKVNERITDEWNHLKEIGAAKEEGGDGKGAVKAKMIYCGLSTASNKKGMGNETEDAKKLEEVLKEEEEMFQSAGASMFGGNGEQAKRFAGRAMGRRG